LYRYLTHALPGLLGLESIKWNFTKFRVGKNGEPLKRFAPTDKPENLTADIEAALQ
jgi:glutathione peroxidase